MNWVLLKSIQKDSLHSISPFPSTSIPNNLNPDNNKISPSILLIIVILAVIFFISGLLHLLVRFLFRPSNRVPDDLDNVTALQGQLQQLFHLHDAGVDQSFIDTLPVFLYKAIIGLKNPFDCAVCLCEFEADDKLRLLPKCSHAFHLECIDTWLLSHSTCPLCRGSLLPEFSSSNARSPVVLVLESGSESSREIGLDRETAAASGVENAQLGFLGEGEFGSFFTDVGQKPCEIVVKDEAVREVSDAKVVPVKLGKFRNVDEVGRGEEGSSSTSRNCNLDERRCFSMGSFEYVLDESSQLQVAIKPPVRKQGNKKASLPLTPGHRIAMSECGGHSSRDGFKGFDGTSSEIHGPGSVSNAAVVGRRNKESFSISKIWLRSKKDKLPSAVDSSRRAVSFRLPLQRADELKPKTDSSRAVSEIDVSDWGSRGSELAFDLEVGSCHSLESQANPPSFARRTLLWLVGRQNKVVHSSSTHQV
ncbi:RING-H2 finger protein ATL13-like [Magnolia sinica]|uniref:RING-H2 finger protein ATL13-like n=1 Tax=Magnolia sinica TaxID=86752 RepID=UPI00265AA038|nr:RING-H2 finger protein ATL13-like [Magnolia sinica]